ncbi:Thiol peroxidase, Bcp-type [Brachybacterium faecium]|uniref:thioredoxin-dependent peroxiredoxin n=1 Tax=Brachybacterium faecium (strain ATCC 43885 / DSM 4810 / JCM 11609 / LMG 19847 / NBRC 14762 / NCIMB 9860 / 6-10) TaxID=446465 RepID=C7M9Y8_BRAFD|nr:peroxiredoxin [Brachybacterium faecium]ACU84682.1 Peroxiredoxin [Brachybacterium faecium DSM 4810]SLM99351.1 Thiol peroxidase, Bcp-type [Brachybacterium faecium]
MPQQLSPGDRAPDLDLADTRGDRVTLADLHGRRTVVYFYPKAFTPGCTTEACDFRDHESALDERGYRILGISADTPDTLADFATTYELPFTLLSDPDSRTARAWGAWGEREIAGERSEGPLRSTIVLDEDGVVLAADYAVGAAGHVATLIDTLGSRP